MSAAVRRTPLNGIVGGVELFMSSSSVLSAEQEELLEIIKSSGEVVLQIIADILDLSKIEAGKSAQAAQGAEPGRR